MNTESRVTVTALGDDFAENFMPSRQRGAARVIKKPFWFKLILVNVTGVALPKYNVTSTTPDVFPLIEKLYIAFAAYVGILVVEQRAAKSYPLSQYVLVLELYWFVLSNEPPQVIVISALADTTVDKRIQSVAISIFFSCLSPLSKISSAERTPVTFCYISHR